MTTLLLACVLVCLATGMASYILFLTSLGDLKKHDPEAVGRLRRINFPGFSRGYQPFPWQILELARSPRVAHCHGLRLKLRAAGIAATIGVSLCLLLLGIGLFSLLLELA
jgi:hypothetical protein